MNKAFIFAFLIAFAAAEYTLDEGVVVLTQDNFDSALAEFDFALVEFYAPWCGHCKKLAPEYAKAAQELATSNPEIKLCKVDSTEEKDLASKFGVKGYPTLKFFRKGSSTPADYEGGRTHPEIVNWLRKKTGPVSVEFETVADLEKVIADNELVGAFLGSLTGTAHSDFLAVAGNLDDVVFYHSEKQEIRDHYGAADDTFILFKKFDEGKNVYKGPFSVSSLQNFISEHKYPVVMPFDQKAAQRIFGEKVNALLLVTADSDLEASRKILEEVAPEVKDKLALSYSVFGDGLGDRVAEYIGVSRSESPALRIIAHSETDMQKYKFEGQLNAENVKSFVDDWANKRIQPFLKSEPVPETNDEPVKVVVGKTFKEIVLDSDDDVLMEFYAPWCGHCKSLAPTYEAVAKQLQGVSGIVIAKMDATANEAEGVSIRGFPTLKFYKKGRKSQPIDFEGDRTEEGFIEFLKKNSNADFSSGEQKVVDSDL